MKILSSTVHEPILQRCERSIAPHTALVAGGWTLSAARGTGAAPAIGSTANSRALYVDVHHFLEQLRSLEWVDVAVFLVAQRNIVEFVRLVRRHQRDGLDEFIETLEQDGIVWECLDVAPEMANVHGQLGDGGRCDTFDTRGEWQRKDRGCGVGNRVEEHQVLERRRQGQQYRVDDVREVAGQCKDVVRRLRGRLPAQPVVLGCFDEVGHFTVDELEDAVLGRLLVLRELGRGAEGDGEAGAQGRCARRGKERFEFVACRREVGQIDEDLHDLAQVLGREFRDETCADLGAEQVVEGGE